MATIEPNGKTEISVEFQSPSGGCKLYGVRVTPNHGTRCDIEGVCGNSGYNGCQDPIAVAERNRTNP